MRRWLLFGLACVVGVLLLVNALLQPEPGYSLVRLGYYAAPKAVPLHELTVFWGDTSYWPTLAPGSELAFLAYPRGDGDLTLSYDFAGEPRMRSWQIGPERSAAQYCVEIWIGALGEPALMHRQAPCAGYERGWFAPLASLFDEPRRRGRAPVRIRLCAEFLGAHHESFLARARFPLGLLAGNLRHGGLSPGLNTPKFPRGQKGPPLHSINS